MKELIISVQYGSLGDHILHSALPRVAKITHGYDKVYISNNSQYINPKYKDFVWLRNPHIDGFTNLTHEFPSFGSVPDGKNILDFLMDFYGLPDDGVRFREPEIYYEPKIMPELADAVIYEPNHGNQYGIPSMAQVDEYFRANNITVTHQMESLVGTRNQDTGRALPYVPKLSTTSLEHFCDIIYSCKAFYCFTTGAATLAAALHKPITVLYVDGILPMFHHSKLHNFVRL